MSPARLPFAALVTAMLLAAGPAQPEETGTDRAAVEAVVRDFHAALAAGDSQTAAAFLASDAVVLEGGDLETRQQYVEHHLPADITFAQSVPSRYVSFGVTVNGDTAWVNATTVTQGTYKEKPLSLVGAETVVLSRTPSGWLIQTIHWSARKAD
jgi:ketosteroid isomerase-like protein